MITYFIQYESIFVKPLIKIFYLLENVLRLSLNFSKNKFDVIVWATPVYYYEMSGQMKTMIDRANSLYGTDYKFREVYLITTAADGSKGVVQSVINGVNGWIACFNGVKLCGFIDGVGLEAPNDVKENQRLLEQAYNMGKNM